MLEAIKESKDDNPHNRVGIVGCGWLGKALARTLISEGVDVIATRSNLANCADLIAKGVNAKPLALPSPQPELNAHEVFNCQSIVIAITPQFRAGRVDYPDKVKQLILAAEQSGNVEHIILLSSSAIYNGLSGNVTENSSLDFSADKVTLLHHAEQAVLAFNSNAKVQRSHVLRLSGLVGDDRHPGKFLAGKSTIAINTNAKVNLIHQQDAVGIISALLNSKIDSGIFNGVSQTQASKQHYYQVAAKALAMPKLVFTSNSHVETARTVKGDKVQQLLSYQFVYPDLLSWL
jgi:nucleoside-diphosphate-sugar epimerase